MLFYIFWGDFFRYLLKTFPSMRARVYLGVHFCVCCRASYVRAQARQPGGASGRERRLQMPGAGRSPSVTALEEGRGRDSSHQVREYPPQHPPTFRTHLHRGAFNSSGQTPLL